MKIFTLPYDQNIHIGWGPFTLPDDHPFYRAACVHDMRFDGLIDQTGTMTLSQIDREFLRNCLRAAWSEKWFDGKWFSEFKLAGRIGEAYVCYRICRAWSVLVRAGLDDYLEEK